METGSQGTCIDDASYRRLVRRARRRVGYSDAEDCVQETLLILMTNRTRVRDPPAFATAILYFVMCRNLAARYGRKGESVYDWEPIERLYSSGEPSPEEVLIEKERREVAQRLLSTAPAEQREVLTRFYIEEQPADRIKCEMGITDTQFRLLKSRALGRVAERYARMAA